MVRGGLLTNWCARAAWATTWVSSGVGDASCGLCCCCCCCWSLCNGSEGSEVSSEVILRSGVAWMSPGATIHSIIHIHQPICPFPRGITRKVVYKSTSSAVSNPHARSAWHCCQLMMDRPCWNISGVRCETRNATRETCNELMRIDKVET